MRHAYSKHSYDMVFEHKGHTFGLRTEFDESMGAPWKEHGSHGVVSEWTTRGKAPGERVLNKDHGSYRYYDFQETMKIAKRDGWGPRERIEGETEGQALARAVEQDFEFLRSWCNDEWHWCGVIVELLDSDDEPTGETGALWGIEDNESKYIEEVGHELADEICYRVDNAYAARAEAERPDMYGTV